MIGKHLLLNGDFKDASTPVVMFNNRSFSYGDGLFETIRAIGTEPFFVADHYKRLIEGVEKLRMDVPGGFNETLMFNDITRLLKKNRIYKGGRVRYTIYRDSDGFYTPDANRTSYLISSSSLENEQFVINKKGLNVEIYSELKKPVNQLSNLKTANALLYVMAGIFKKDNKIDECLLLNEKGCIIETIASNIFYIKGEVAFTPALESGCVAGTMRRKVIKLLTEMGIEVLLKEEIIEDALLDADEVFLTNAIQGVQWVKGYKQRRYFKKVANELVVRLNKLLIS